MRIALDGMGGDRAPAVVVEGALKALKEGPPGLEIVLVGQPEVLSAELARLGAPEGALRVHPASQAAGMHDAPSHVLRQMRDSSIRVCFDLHKAGEVQAVVSAGNSGATMAVGSVVMGRLPEVDRPALASALPGLAGPTVLIDVGANVDCSPMMLLQFGYMGAAYAERVLGVARPAVGLMSIGEEDVKGNHVVKLAHEFLKNSGLNFVGNVEGRDLFSGRAAVVVCDGFVGNVCLKVSEGLAEAMMTLLKDNVFASLRGKVGALLLKPALKGLAERLDYASYGGAPLLGINGVGLICHGASSARAIASAVKAATECVRGGLVENLAEGLAQFRGRLLGDAAGH
jgi:glycerol-3-phosphate acyltransferase PlsX